MVPFSKTEKLEAEKLLHTLTRMAWECKDYSYWDRLQIFCLFFNERRMERYKVLYLWKSLNGHVLSLGIGWNTRSGIRLLYPKIVGSYGKMRTLQRNSIKWEGVRLYNSLPEYLRVWKGLNEKFKEMLENYIGTIPDQPEIPGLKPGGRTMMGDPSNSIADWSRFLDLEEDDCEDSTDFSEDNSNKSVITHVLGGLGSAQITVLSTKTLNKL